MQVYLAASPMTITTARKKAVKFLVPFKSTGLQVLMRKAYWQPINRDHEVLKSFNILTALSSTVWALTILAMFLVGCMIHATFTDHETETILIVKISVLWQNFMVLEEFGGWRVVLQKVLS